MPTPINGINIGEASEPPHTTGVHPFAFQLDRRKHLDILCVDTRQFAEQLEIIRRVSAMDTPDATRLFLTRLWVVVRHARGPEHYWDG